MQSFKNITYEKLFKGDAVRQTYVLAVKQVVEAHCKAFKWKIFYEYYDGAEGIRYEFDLGFVDWVVEKKTKPAQLRIPFLFLRTQLFEILRKTHFD